MWAGDITDRKGPTGAKHIGTGNKSKLFSFFLFIFFYSPRYHHGDRGSGKLSAESSVHLSSPTVDLASKAFLIAIRRGSYSEDIYISFD